MRPYFTRERFGRPQFLAGALLLAFFLQALWLLHAELAGAPGIDAREAVRIGEGWKQLHGSGIAGAPTMDSARNLFDNSQAGFDSQHSPLISLLNAAPLLIWPRDLSAEYASYWRWLSRLPFVACGVLLGASLWYVARRLCGNTGGFVALTFYCFSPSLIQASAAWHTEPGIVTAWGAFGTIFTAIAVAHTLYAPREVVLWNWRRIVLLGISMAIAVGSQFSMIVVVPMALAFLLYVAPVRQRAGLAIWSAACGLGFVLFLAMYFFHIGAFVSSMRDAEFWGATWHSFTIGATYKQLASEIGRACPALALAIPVALITYAAWPRTRYFGNTGPLAVAVIFILLGMANPHLPGAGFVLAAVPFLFIFVSGVLADLLETSYRPLVSACVLALLVTYVARTIYALIQVPAG